MPQHDRPRKTPTRSRSVSMTTGRALGLGLELGVAIGGLAYLGYLGDGYFDTSPVLTMIGAALGIVGGVYNVIRAVMPGLGRAASPRPGNGEGGKRE